jgi:hypothetical protein
MYGYLWGLLEKAAARPRNTWYKRAGHQFTIANLFADAAGFGRFRQHGECSELYPS